MTLEEAIQQPQFRHLYEKTLINLIYTTNILRASVDSLLEPFNISNGQYNILRILRGQQGKSLSVQAIKCRMLEKNPDVSRLINRLYRMGLVNRCIDPENRRKAEVSITPSGLELLLRIEPLLEKTFNQFSYLPVEDLEALNRYLDTVRNLLVK